MNGHEKGTSLSPAFSLTSGVSLREEDADAISRTTCSVYLFYWPAGIHDAAFSFFLAGLKIDGIGPTPPKGDGERQANGACRWTL